MAAQATSTGRAAPWRLSSALARARTISTATRPERAFVALSPDHETTSITYPTGKRGAGPWTTSGEANAVQPPSHTTGHPPAGP